MKEHYLSLSFSERAEKEVYTHRDEHSVRILVPTTRRDDDESGLKRKWGKRGVQYTYRLAECTPLYTLPPPSERIYVSPDDE